MIRKISRPDRNNFQATSPSQSMTFPFPISLFITDALDIKCL